MGRSHANRSHKSYRSHSPTPTNEPTAPFAALVASYEKGEPGDAAASRPGVSRDAGSGVAHSRRRAAGARLSEARLVRAVGNRFPGSKRAGAGRGGRVAAAGHPARRRNGIARAGAFREALLAELDRASGGAGRAAADRVGARLRGAGRFVRRGEIAFGARHRGCPGERAGRIARRRPGFSRAPSGGEFDRESGRAPWPIFCAAASRFQKKRRSPHFSR